MYRPQALNFFSSRSTQSPPNGHDNKNVSVLGQALIKVQQGMAESTVPWFETNMPASYFRAISETDQLQHLNAITALQYVQQPELLLTSPDGKVFSFIRSGKCDKVGVLTHILSQIPNFVDGAGLARVKIFSSLDGTIALDVFRFGHQVPFLGISEDEKKHEGQILEYLSDLQAGKYLDSPTHPKPHGCFEPEKAKAFFRKCNAMYVQHSSPRRVATQMELFDRVSGTEGVVIDVEHGWEQLKQEENKIYSGNGEPQTMLTIVSANVLQKNSLQKAAKYLALSNIKILRAHLDTVDDGENGVVSLSRILVAPGDAENQQIDWDLITRDLSYLKWIDDRALNLSVKYPEINIGTSEIIIAYANMLHGVLAKEDPFAYALRRIFYVVQHPQNLPISVAIAQLFEKRFNPDCPLSDKEFNLEYDRIKLEIRENVEAEDAINLLEKMLMAVKLTLRTNKFIVGRYALALRIDPSLMGHGSVGTDIPFGVFFIHGRRFNAFHVRFRDISRGGLRVVAPPTIEQHSFESSRQFNEAYSLAFAQQLKNKDIPEGGSKAVVLVSPLETGDNDREFVIRKSIKAFSDALLDLNTSDETVKSRVVDHYGKDELIYLGPDENIIPEDITWMTQRAIYRQYPIPRAFISSKAIDGINHKVYGVTSEGVAVFADVALLSQGFDPRNSPFTVKLTGGTDGDVAGNMLRILNREYGSNATVVGICDGTATVENPEGLDMTELLRLVDEELPLADYNPLKLGTGENGIFLKANTPEGIRMRNSMHNRVTADLFLPAGGRPATINEHNWKSYINSETGEPSSRLIVEGANLFITPEARQLLFDEAGVVIVKDSSANKCGVICSSYEIMASMLFDTETFVEMKEELVQDVLTKLRSLARVEAELLFREYKKDPKSSLPPHSERISRAIIRLHDAIANGLENLENVNEERFMDLIVDHLPEKIQNVEKNAITERVPLAYLKATIASSLASRIVYREGLQYVESIPESSLNDVALAYLDQEKRVDFLLNTLKDVGGENVEEISDLLRRGGIRAGIEKV